MEEQRANGRAANGNLLEELERRRVLGLSFTTGQFRPTGTPPTWQRPQEQRWLENVFGGPERFGSIREESLRPAKYEAEEADRTPIGLVDGFDKVCQLWNLDAHQRAYLLGLPESTNLSDQIIAGRIKPFSRDTTDRMAYVLGISLGLAELFDGDTSAELIWLEAPREELSGSAPLNFILEGSMRNLIRVAELVLAARGLE